MGKRILIIFFLFFITQGYSQGVKILFDASKAEMAGNADWIIDSDLFNLGTNFNGAMVPGRGNDSNPQNIPNPSQDNITPSTLETYWNGALSNWAIDLVKQGFHVETLPYNDSITFGNSSNPLDLSNYKVFIIAEPNILFTPSEMLAVKISPNGDMLAFVKGESNGAMNIHVCKTIDANKPNAIKQGTHFNSPDIYRFFWGFQYHY